jgi:hypothetical protein
MMFCWPLGLPLHQVDNIFVDDVTNSQRLVDDAQNHKNQVEADINSTQSLIQAVNDLMTGLSSLNASNETLTNQVNDTAASVEQRKQSSRSIETQTIKTFGDVKASSNEASAAGFSLTKKQYATSILKTLDKALWAKNVYEVATSILVDLRDHDDAAKSVASIPHPTLPDQSFLQVLLTAFSQK